MEVDDNVDEYYFGEWKIVRTSQENSKELDELSKQCSKYRPSQNPQHMELINFLAKMLPNWPLQNCVLLASYAYDPMEPYMKGVQYNIPTRAIRNWTIHYCQPYIHRTQFEDIKPPDGSEYTYVFWGAKHIEEDTFHLGCVGEIKFVYDLEKTQFTMGTNNAAGPHNDTYWYLCPNFSCGFSSHPLVSLHYADASEMRYGYEHAYPEPESRLSWNLDNGGSTGGFRAGVHLNLGSERDGYTWWKFVAFL